MLNLFNVENIKSFRKSVQTAPKGFRYGFLPNLFKKDVYAELIKQFPDVKKFVLRDKPDSGGGRKRFYVGPNYFSGRHYGCVCDFSVLPEIWKNVLEEVSSPEFMNLLGETTGVIFNSLADFGFTYGNEGCMQEPHIDGAVRPNDPNTVRPTIAFLLYFNEKHGGSSGTFICEPDRKTVIFQAPDLRNGLFFFEQHPESWHGFHVLPPGEERRLISLSYSLEENPINLKTSLQHKMICKRYAKNKLKQILGK